MLNKPSPAVAKWVLLAGLAMLLGVVYVILYKGAEFLLESAVGEKPGGWFGLAFFLASIVAALLLTRRQRLS